MCRIDFFAGQEQNLQVHTAERSQVRLILQHLADVFKTEIDEQLRSICAQRAASGSLQSGGTIRVAVRFFEVRLSQSISSSVDQVVAISKDAEAFAMVKESIHEQVAFVETRLEGIAALGRGKPLPLGETDSILTGCRQLFEQARTRLNDQLEIHRFTFTVPAAPSVSTTVTKKNPGGKPVAPHWDQMWAAIAVQLYNGDLQPKSQADIERAMKDWLVAHDLDAGDTAVRDRARPLWRMLQESD